MTGNRSVLAQDEIAALLEKNPAHTAARIIARLVERGETLACAESLTGGLLSDALVSVPGASAAFQGSAVTYATSAKASVLGVDAALLERAGAVDPEVVSQMSVGAKELYAAHYAIATTGVAGPTEQDGKPVGLAYIGIAGPGEGDGLVYELRLEPATVIQLVTSRRHESNRAAIRHAVTQIALGLLLQGLEPVQSTDHSV